MMADKKDCCKEETQLKEKKLIKATELPIHGNPYPPKDFINDEKPGLLETKVASIRVMLQPYVSPIATVYEKTNDVLSIGLAHSQSTMQRLAGNQSSVSNAFIMTASGLFGVALARRKGIIKKLLFGTVFFAGATAACYPKDVEEKTQVLLYIAKNKLPVLAKQQYERLRGDSSSPANDTKVVENEPKS